MAYENLVTDQDEEDPGNQLWYKDAIIYEVHVRAFYDSDADGIGDFPGLTQKLDYLQALGVTAIWLLPFYPSPLKDDGYDIADYQGVHPDYGTLEDFRAFLEQAHQRGLRVITELVLNHTSDQHAWFQRARRAAAGTPERDYYVWSERDDRYPEARVIFQDFELSNWTWDPVAGAYFWHRFYSHQPDLNYGNPSVLEAMLGVIDFWLGLGVDGLRLDAVPYLTESEGTQSENLPGTHRILKQIRSHVDERFAGRMLLAEANQWPEDAAAYFGTGDECQMAFHFPLMPRLFMSLRRGDSFPIVDILSQTPDIPPTCQWALFLRNHDELTLEMVTEEERLYMWRTYAHDPQARLNLGIRRRLAPLLGNDRRRIELMNALLLSMPGTPVLYYGDEIGMGDNIYLGDRNGVRTPMQWGSGLNAGFSDARPQRLYLPLVIDPEYHYSTLHVEAQEYSNSSLLKWMRRLLGLRKRYRAFGRGSMAFLKTGNKRTLAFLRCYGSEIILVVANLSRFTQHLELDLSQFAGKAPFDVFGRGAFPVIGDERYPFTAGPHAFNWYSIEQTAEDRGERSRAQGQWPRLVVDADWLEALRGQSKVWLEDLLPTYLDSHVWYQGKGNQLLGCHIQHIIPLGPETGHHYLMLLRTEYADADPELYAVPTAYADGKAADSLKDQRPYAVIAEIAFKSSPERHGVLYDAAYEPQVVSELVLAIVNDDKKSRSSGLQSSLSTEWPARLELGPQMINCLEPASANTLAALGEVAVLKLYRRVEEGINPDVEMGTFLTTHNYAHAPRVFASLCYPMPFHETITLATLQQYVKNDGNAWVYTLQQVREYLGRVRRGGVPTRAPALTPQNLLEGLDTEVPPEAAQLIGPYLDQVLLLSRRTAELHLTLASDHEHPTFAPEPMTDLYRRSLYQSMRALTLETLGRLESAAAGLDPLGQRLAGEVLQRQSRLLPQFEALRSRHVHGWRIRCHGNLHLEEVLRTGADFAIIDFEGEATIPVYERRLKAHPLTDVVSLLHSFFYAARVAFDETREQGSEPATPAMEDDGVRFWQYWVAVAFLRQYRQGVEKSDLFPTSQNLNVLFPALYLARSLHELEHELRWRPDWAGIPLHDLLEFLRAT